jgi:hypothetical protein
METLSAFSIIRFPFSVVSARICPFPSQKISHHLRYWSITSHVFSRSPASDSTNIESDLSNIASDLTNIAGDLTNIAGDLTGIVR